MSREPAVLQVKVLGKRKSMHQIKTGNTYGLVVLPNDDKKGVQQENRQYSERPVYVKPF